MKMEIETMLKSAAAAHGLALEALAAGRVGDAKSAYVRAADDLLSAAELSRPGLRERRVDMARRLLETAEGLHSAQPGRSPAASSTARDLREGGDQDETGWLVGERPDTRFSDVAGLEDVKEQIRLKLIYPYLHPQEASRYGIQPGGGILLFGPPGTGKTLIARAVAGEVEAAFFAIKPSAVMSEWVGVAERNIARLFAETARHPLSVLFIDEIEALTPRRRGSGSTVMQRVVPQMLAELDGFQKRARPLLFIGATNEPQAIDPAILRPGRLDRLIYVPPPDAAARERILELNLRQAPLAQGLNLHEIARLTGHFSGADMAALCRQVREKVFIEAIQHGIQRELRQDDFESVLAQMRPSISPEDLNVYSRFK